MTVTTNGTLATQEINIPQIKAAKDQVALNVVPVDANMMSDTIQKEAPEVLNGTALGVALPNPRFELFDRFIDEPRALRVAVIGGGLSGILAGILLPAKVPNIKLTIYEKNHDLVS